MMNEEICNAVLSFYFAIMDAKYNREFKWRDRMSNFPRGCCDDACDLLAYYLYEKYGIRTKQGKGYSKTNDTYHVWLIMDERVIIDITVKQLKEFYESSREVYLGKENSFYIGLTDKEIYDNYNIKNDERLWNDYKKILKYMRDK